MEQLPTAPRITWRTWWWGAEDASFARRLWIVGLLAFLALALCGIVVDFIPAPGLYGPAAAAVFFFVGVVSKVVLFIHASRAGRVPHLFRQGLLKTALGLAILPVMTGFMLWLVCVKALPWAFSRLAGAPHALETRVRTDHSSSRRSCDHRIEGGALDATFPGYMCIRQSYYAAHPDAVVVVRLAGKRTALGFAITSVGHVRDGSR